MFHVEMVYSQRPVLLQSIMLIRYEFAWQPLIPDLISHGGAEMYCVAFPPNESPNSHSG